MFKEISSCGRNTKVQTCLVCLSYCLPICEFVCFVCLTLRMNVCFFVYLAICACVFFSDNFCFGWSRLSSQLVAVATKKQSFLNDLQLRRHIFISLISLFVLFLLIQLRQVNKTKKSSCLNYVLPTSPSSREVSSSSTWK